MASESESPPSSYIYPKLILKVMWRQHYNYDCICLVDEKIVVFLILCTVSSIQKKKTMKTFEKVRVISLEVTEG